MARYINVRQYTRQSGIGRHCIRTGCEQDAYVAAVRKMPDGKQLKVRYCNPHAQQARIIE